MLITGSGPIVAAGYANVSEFEARRFIDSDAGEVLPLGRAELVKLFGLLCGTEDAAVSIFGLIESRYLNAKQAALGTRKRPSVMLGVPFSGTWSVTSGASYMAQFLRDANVEYKNYDNSISRSLSAASFVTAFKEAQYWINANIFQVDGSQMTMDKLVSGNISRTALGDRALFSQILAFQCNNVYAHDGLVKAPNTGNPFFEVRSPCAVSRLMKYSWVCSGLTSYSLTLCESSTATR